MSEIEIRALSSSPNIIEMLSEILIEVVASGGSVSFMHPLDPETARAFWDGALAAAGRGKRVVLGAWDGEVLAGTVALLLDCPFNQPHRAEIAKLISPEPPGRGVAAAWGDRTGRIIDPSGHVWTVSTRVEETSSAEREERWSGIVKKDPLRS